MSFILRLRELKTADYQRLIQLCLLSVAIWSVNYARFALGPLQETIHADLGFSDNQMALLQGTAVAIPMAIGSIPIGLYIDNHARRPIFLLFVALAAAATIAIGFCTTFAPLFFARSVVGLSLGAIFVSSYSTAADLYPPTSRGRATMVVAFGEVAGGPTAFWLGGMLLSGGASILETDAGQQSWRTALWWMCVPMGLAAISMLALKDHKRVMSAAKTEPFSLIWAQYWRYRRLIFPLFLARIMVWTADGAVLVWGAPIFSRRFMLPPNEIGALMGGALLISGVVGPILGGVLSDICQSYGGPRLTVVSLALLALASIPVGLFALAPGVTLTIVGLTIFLTLGFTIGVAALSVSTIVIPIEIRGSYLAITVFIAAAFALGVAPVTVSGLSGILGGEGEIGVALAIVCAGMSVVGAFVFGFGSRDYPNKSECSRVPLHLGRQTLGS